MADTSIEITEAITYELPEFDVCGGELGMARHDAVVDRILAADDLSADAVGIDPDLFDRRKIGANAIWSLLETYGEHSPYCADGGCSSFEPDHLIELYAPDAQTDVPERPYDTLRLQEAPYYPDPAAAESDASYAFGELDVAEFRLIPAPTAHYIEVKSDGTYYHEAKDQLDRFAEYAAAAGWQSELEMALYDRNASRIYRCKYEPSGSEDRGANTSP